MLSPFRPRQLDHHIVARLRAAPGWGNPNLRAGSPALCGPAQRELGRFRVAAGFHDVGVGIPRLRLRLPTLALPDAGPYCRRVRRASGRGLIRWTARRHPGTDGPDEANLGVVTTTTLESSEVHVTSKERSGEAAVVVIRGSVESLGSSCPPLAPGDAVFLPHGVEFDVRNCGSADAQLLILRAPKVGPTCQRTNPGPPPRGAARRYSAATPGPESGVSRRQVNLDAHQQHGRRARPARGVCGVRAWRRAPLHRHRFAAEVLHVLTGGGCRHLGAGLCVPLIEGDLTLVQAGEWHGLRNAGPRPAEVVFAYLGVGSIDADGYELDGS